MAHYDKPFYRSVILYNIKRNLTTRECFEEMSKVLEDNAPSTSTVEYWYRNFHRKIFDLEDAPRSGAPVKARTDKNVALANKLVEEDRHITVENLAEELSISVGTVEQILHDDLNLHKICARWVPHGLTADQRQQRVRCCEQMLPILESNRKYDVVTGDESYIYYCDPKRKEQNKEWIEKGSGAPIVVRRPRSIKKHIYEFFLDRNGVIFKTKLLRKPSMNAASYIENCLKPLCEILRNRRPKSGLRGRLLHHDNAKSHSALATAEFLAEQELDIMVHPLYSPDLSPCDFWLFPKLKDLLKGKTFSTEEELDSAIDGGLASFDKKFYHEMFDDWVSRCKRCIEVGGAYFEKL